MVRIFNQWLKPLVENRQNGRLNFGDHNRHGLKFLINFGRLSREPMSTYRHVGQFSRGSNTVDITGHIVFASDKHSFNVIIISWLWTAGRFIAAPATKPRFDTIKYVPRYLTVLHNCEPILHKPP